MCNDGTGCGFFKKRGCFSVIFESQVKDKLPKVQAFSDLVNQLFKSHSDGFYVHLPKESRITNKQKIAQYVGRYIRHPAIANSRLHSYDGNSVTFWYKDHEGARHFVTMEVQEFIKALIQHIPDRHFKMIRYYGAYSRRIKKRYSRCLQRSIKQTTFSDFKKELNKWAPQCPFCGGKMKFVWYEKGPPSKTLDVNCKITDWSLVMA